MKLSNSQIKKHTERYYRDLANYERLNQRTESTTEMAFKSLLKNVGDEIGLILIKPYESLYNDKKIIPDGILTTQFGRYVGYWEAKDTEDDLDKEIYKKLKKGYPRINTIFEDTQMAVLYQDSYEMGRYNLKDENQLTQLLHLFFSYNEPVLEEFKKAVEKFKENIPRLASALFEKITIAKNENPIFTQSVAQFIHICSASFHSDIKENDVDDMLIQHLLTERIFRKVFDNPDFVNKNVIAVQLEQMIHILTQSAFSRSEFFKDIDFFYRTIEEESAKIDSDSEKQGFLNTIYELFFQSYSKKNADKNGIVYTPQSIVRFMVKFTNSLLEQEFGKSFSDEGVTIIDPCTGTGNFVVEILKNLHPLKLSHKYENDIFCNEIMLLPYYVASVNIEYFYYKQTGKYKPFENIVFTDTLELIKEPENPEKSLFSFNEVNTERAKRQLNTDFVVIIGNPPYSRVGNYNEKTNFKNNSHKIIDKNIEKTYSSSSKAKLKQGLYDTYVKFFRWATDRLKTENGVICFITNNSFMTDICFDGMRSHLLRDFQRIYHFDLGGDVYLNPKLSGTKHNVFGIKLGVGITFLVRNTKHKTSEIFYKNVEAYLTKDEKYEILNNLREQNDAISDFDWKKVYIDSNNNYNFGDDILISQQFENYFPLWAIDEKGIFKFKYPGINTSRTEWVYDFSTEKLIEKIKRTTSFYNSEVNRLEKFYKSSEYIKDTFSIDNFIHRKDSQIKWSDSLVAQLKRLKKSNFDKSLIVNSLLRPFTKKKLYYNRIFIDRPSEFGKLMQIKNQFICFNGLGQQKSFSCIATNLYPEMQVVYNGQTVSMYYVENQQQVSNITDWALHNFIQQTGNEQITREQIFYYVYAILHHEQYRATFDKLLRTSSPRIPVVANHFEAISEIGKELAEIHINFEDVAESEVKIIENKEVDKHYTIEKIVFSKNDNWLIYNDYFTLILPPNIHHYKVNGRSPIQWLADQYKNYTTESDEIIRLIKKLVTVSESTISIQSKLNTFDILNESTIIK